MKPGLYEQIINEQLNHELEVIPEDCKYQEKVDTAEASKILSTYVAELLKRKMDDMYESNGEAALDEQIAYINKIIGVVDEDTDELLIEHKGEQLLSVLSKQDERILLGKKAKDIKRSESSMAYSSLFTGAVREPQMLL